MIIGNVKLNFLNSEDRVKFEEMMDKYDHPPVMLNISSMAFDDKGVDSNPHTHIANLDLESMLPEEIVELGMDAMCEYIRDGEGGLDLYKVWDLIEVLGDKLLENMEAHFHFVAIAGIENSIALVELLQRKITLEFCPLLELSTMLYFVLEGVDVCSTLKRWMDEYNNMVDEADSKQEYFTKFNMNDIDNIDEIDEDDEEYEEIDWV